MEAASAIGEARQRRSTASRATLQAVKIDPNKDGDTDGDGDSDGDEDEDEDEDEDVDVDEDGPRGERRGIINNQARQFSGDRGKDTHRRSSASALRVPRVPCDDLHAERGRSDGGRLSSMGQMYGRLAGQSHDDDASSQHRDDSRHSDKRKRGSHGHDGDQDDSIEFDCDTKPLMNHKIRRSKDSAVLAAETNRSNNKTLWDSQWTDEVLDMDVKTLNSYLKAAQLTDAEVHDLKEARRRRNNRVYAKRSRLKRLQKKEIEKQGGGDTTSYDNSKEHLHRRVQVLEEENTKLRAREDVYKAQIAEFKSMIMGSSAHSMMMRPPGQPVFIAPQMAVHAQGLGGMAQMANPGANPQWYPGSQGGMPGPMHGAPGYSVNVGTIGAPPWMHESMQSRAEASMS